MPTGPKGERRPADVIGNAVKVMRIATGEEPENVESQKDRNAADLGRVGGRKRADKMTKKDRSAAAQKAAKARWGIRAVPSEEE